MHQLILDPRALPFYACEVRSVSTGVENGTNCNLARAGLSEERFLPAFSLCVHFLFLTSVFCNLDTQLSNWRILLRCPHLYLNTYCQLLCYLLIFFSNKINKNKYIPLKGIPTPFSAGGGGGEGQKDTCELDGPFSRDLKENNSH